MTTYVTAGENGIEVTVGLMSRPQLDAVNAADAPSGTNEFVTMSALTDAVVEAGDTNAEVVLARTAGNVPGAYSGSLRDRVASAAAGIFEAGAYGGIQAAIDAADTAGGGRVVARALTYAVSSSPATPAISIPAAVHLELGPYTVISDSGTGITVQLNSEGLLFHGGLTGGVIRNTGSALIGVELRNCRNAYVNTIVEGGYSTVGVYLYAQDGLLCSWNRLEGYVRAYNSNAPAIGLACNTVGTGAITGNDFNMILYTSPIQMYLQNSTGTVDTNIVRGGMNGGTNAIILGDGTNAVNNTVLMYPRIEGQSGMALTIRSGCVGTVGHFHNLTANYVDQIDDNGTQTVIYTGPSSAGRSAAAYKTFNDTLSLTTGQSKYIAVFRLEENKSIRIYSAGVVLTSDGSAQTWAHIELYNLTGASTSYTLANSRTSRGYPLHTLEAGAGGLTLGIRIRNSDASTRELTGWMTVSIDGE